MSSYINIADLRRKVGQELVDNGYFSKEAVEQKQLFDREFKKYLAKQINILKGRKFIDLEKINDVNASYLINALSKYVPEEEHYDVFGQMTHYIMAIAGEIQGYGGILWHMDDNKELITNPEAEFGRQGIWDKIVGHERTPHVKMLNFTYEVFQNYLKENNNKNKVYTAKQITHRH